jgi:hypothetical protein
MNRLGFWLGSGVRDDCVRTSSGGTKGTTAIAEGATSDTESSKGPSKGINDVSQFSIPKVKSNQDGKEGGS